MLKWKNDHILITPPNKPKKITATRFGAVLGQNQWETPFKTWCAITRIYEEPFKETVYTNAGKIIEPKQIEYMRKAYAMTNLRTPTDVFGDNYFFTTNGDFFPNNPVFGGMWDSILVDEDGKPSTVIEFKTTKRIQDWKDTVPEHYALQASLYAWLLGVDDVIMVASFLDYEDYESPENFTPNASNTLTYSFKVSERYPNFASLIKKALEWWNSHVVNGCSPTFDANKDGEILDYLRTNRIDSEDINTILEEADRLQKEIDDVENRLKDKMKRLRELKEEIKDFEAENFREEDKKVELESEHYVWRLTKTFSKAIDLNALIADGLDEKYSVEKTNYTLRIAEKGEI